MSWNVLYPKYSNDKVRAEMQLNKQFQGVKMITFIPLWIWMKTNLYACILFSAFHERWGYSGWKLGYRNVNALDTHTAALPVNRWVDRKRKTLAADGSREDGSGSPGFADAPSRISTSSQHISQQRNELLILNKISMTDYICNFH